jgi:peptidoglycan/LPS O-acetylase OafA/YrhL
MWALVGLAALMIQRPIGLNDSRQIAAARKTGAGAQTSRQALAEAFGQRSYVLLVVGYFVCGFHVAFVGGWGGGYLYDLTGNYNAMWWISIVLGVVSALLHWPIVEKPVARPAALAAQPA